MVDKSKFLKAHILRKKAPKGVDPAKHERCMKEVKGQGKDVGSAHAICTSSMKKADKKHKDQIPGGLADGKTPKDFKEESIKEGIAVEMEHTSDKNIAREIAFDHLTEDKDYYKKLQTIEKEKKTTKSFVKEFKKSYDYRNHGVMIDAKDQQAAEETTDPKLIEYITGEVRNIDIGSVSSMQLGKGILTLTKKDQGLYNGFWKDQDGQIAEKFDDQTVALIAKNLVVKGWIAKDVVSEEPKEDREVPYDYQENSPSYIRIKSGDFEFELKKSLLDFVRNFNCPDQCDIKMAVSVWKTHRSEGGSQKQAVKELLDNWELHSEDFNQILYGVRKKAEDK